MESDENPYFDAGATAGGGGGSTGGDRRSRPGSRADSLTAPLSRPTSSRASRSRSPRSQSPAITPVSENPPGTASQPPPASLARTVYFRPVGDRQQSSIRLRRLSSSANLGPLERIPSAGEREQQSEQQQQHDNGLLRPLSRLRSRSRSRAGSNALPLSQLPTIQDGVAQDFAQGSSSQQPPQVTVRTRDGSVAPGVVLQGHNGNPVVAVNSKLNRPEYDSDIVDLLDVIDPEVATLSSITNVQNSLFVPSLGRFINRRPTYDLSFAQRIPGAFPDVPETEEDEKEPGTAEPVSRQTTLNRTYSITSQITPSHYAVLPSGKSLAGWSREDVDQLNDHVRHMLHSRRSRLKRSFRAFGMYVRKPLGFFVTLYATLITLFGLAWVLFLIGWIYVGEKQLYVINIIDNVLVALFAIVGDGLAPFRAVDTYHMIWIVHYHRLTWKLRKTNALPKLENKNDLPTDSLVPGAACEAQPDLEAAREKETTENQEFSVLTRKQQARLQHHQDKMFKSHTFYKAHETETHHAFPLALLIVIILLLDLHSILQICLGTVTWSTDYRHRSAAATTTLLCCSITANTTAGIVIAVGDRKTRKKEVIERMARQELTDHAMRKVEKDRRAKEAEEMAARKGVGEAGRFDVGSPAKIAYTAKEESG
ncbi:integral membrane protein [Coniochaeta sp. 2T2.1]|nr:integral membrane protein [Coniochaeta sp. 2T2.1]